MGRSERTAVTCGGASVRCACITGPRRFARERDPAGEALVEHTPRAYTSVRASSPAPRSAPVRRSRASRCSSGACHAPKSRLLDDPEVREVDVRADGARQACWPASRHDGRARGRGRRPARRGLPEQYSGRQTPSAPPLEHRLEVGAFHLAHRDEEAPSASPASKTGIMFGWSISAASLDSRSKRSRKSASRASSAPIPSARRSGRAPARADRPRPSRRGRHVSSR